MSCEVANSPFAEPGFASPFHVDNAPGDKVDYAALGDFNYTFGPADQSCVNPQNLSNAGSPSATFDPTLTPDFTPDNSQQLRTSNPSNSLSVLRPSHHTCKTSIFIAALSPNLQMAPSCTTTNSTNLRTPTLQ
jgi:hypothetical protein